MILLLVPDSTVVTIVPIFVAETSNEDQWSLGSSDVVARRCAVAAQSDWRRREGN